MALTGLVFVIVLVHGVATEVAQIQMPVRDVPEDGAYMCFKFPMDDYAGMSLGKECSKQQGHISRGRAVGLNGLDITTGDTIRFDFPEDTGLELGPEAKINYMVLQVHYKHKRIVKPNDQPAATTTLYLTKERRQFSRHVAMMFAKGYIPPNQESYSSEQIFRWTGMTVAVDTYAVHSHGNGMVMENYIIKKDNISLIGRHHHHEKGVTLYSIPMDKPLHISPGDVLVNRCVHKNPTDEPIRFGTEEKEEMCAFTMWFKVPTEKADLFARPILIGQDPQQISWCNNTVYTSHELCELSKTNH